MKSAEDLSAGNAGLMSSARAAVFASMFAAMLLCSSAALAERPRVYALTGGKVITAPGNVIEDGTVVLRDGLIEAVGRNAGVPPDAEVVDVSGMVVHAGFIDACSDIGVSSADSGSSSRGASSAPGQGSGGSPGGGESRDAGTRHPLKRVRPEMRVIDTLNPSEKDLERHRKMGYTAALAVPASGLFRGTSALIALGEGPLSENVVREEVAQHVAMDHGSWGSGYPSSLIGAIAALRQGLEDAKRYQAWADRYENDPRGMRRPETFSAWAPLTRAASGAVPVIFHAEQPNNIPRALKLSREYGLETTLVGTGADAEFLDSIRASGRPVIVPLKLPEKPDLDDPDEAINVSTRRLERYLGARTNPSELASAGVRIAFGTCGLENLADAPKNLRRMIDAGLPEDAALAALTTNAARILGVERIMGSLEPGLAANVVVSSGEPFAEKTKPSRVYVDGVEFVVEDDKPKGDPNAKEDPRGTWSVVYKMRSRTFTREWIISGTKGDYEGTVETQRGLVDLESVELEGNALTIVVLPPGGGKTWEATVIVKGDSFEGSAEFGGMTMTMKGSRTSGPDDSQGGGR